MLEYFLDCSEIYFWVLISKKLSLLLMNNEKSWIKNNYGENNIFHWNDFYIFILSQDKFLVSIRSKVDFISHARFRFAPASYMQTQWPMSMCTCIQATRLYASLLSVFRLANQLPALLRELVGQDFLRKSGVDEKVKCTSPFALKAGGCPIFRPYATFVCITRYVALLLRARKK